MERAESLAPDPGNGGVALPLATQGGGLKLEPFRVRGDVMSDAPYLVRFFQRRKHELVAESEIEAADYIGAIGEALRRGQETAGAIVYATGRGEDADGPGIQIILKIGEVPDTPAEDA